jgi:hypothetical protein
MALISKEKLIDQITITENGIVLYREVTSFIENGIELTKTYHRSSLTPSQDLTGVPEKVVAICKTAWTEEVIAKYKQDLEKQA